MRWPSAGPTKPGLVDEIGTLTFGEIHERSNALARALADLGIGEGDSIAVMCRNHRYFVDVTVAAAKLGADLLYLNTAFAGPQLVEVLEREKPGGRRPRRGVHQAPRQGRHQAPDPGLDRHPTAHDSTVDGLIASAATSDDLEPPERHSRVVILTSGTTGTPKGAPRNEAGIDAAVALLERIPLRAGTRVHIAAPLFHTWGFAHLALGMLLGTTAVLRRRFDPEGCLELVQKEHCEAVVVIPVMLQRIMALPPETLSCLRPLRRAGGHLVRLGAARRPGDQLDGRLRRQPLQHLRLHRGRLRQHRHPRGPPEGTRRRPAGRRSAPRSRSSTPTARSCPRASPGRIFVGNSLLFEGYTGGGNKDMIDGLMSSGDVGRFADGLLYVEGRDDEMIVSGGENVFPKEVEDCLARHERSPRWRRSGSTTTEFGKRLRAFVVLSDSSCTEDDLKGWVKDNLARYKVPREIVFLEELPRNATGKVLKRELAERDSEGRRVTGLTLGGAGPRLHAARPVRPGRHAVVVPGLEGGRDLLLPGRLLGGLHGRDVRHPRPAGGVHDLRHRGPRRSPATRSTRCGPLRTPRG